MGCGGSAPLEKTDDIDYKNVEDTKEDYLPPYIPERSREDVYDPEVTAAIQANVDKMPTGTDSKYSTLLKNLSEGLTKEAQHVTAIYLWMKTQNYQDASLDLEPDGDTPRGYMKMIKTGEGDYTSFFTILCRRSGIPCNILSGIGKDDKYFISKPESQLQTKWTAVYVDDEWRLVHVQWAMEAAKDGNQNDNSPEISDFFFLTDPAKFALLCSPENFRWQLLNQAYSRKEFLGFPNLRPSFFILNTNLINPKTGTVKTARSKTEIELTFPKRSMEHMHVHFNYYFLEPLHVKRSEDIWDDEDEEEEGKKMSKVPKELARYVFMDRKSSKLVFEIGLPAAGKYLFDIYGALEDGAEDKVKDKENSAETYREKEPDAEETGSSNTRKEEKPTDKMEKLCQFRIIAELDPEPDDLEPNPDCPTIGWGPGPRCRELGLIPVSHHEGCIYMKPEEEKEVKFKMTRKLDVMCQLVHDYLPVYELVEMVDCRTKRRDVTVTVKVAEEGRYALKVFCRDAGTKEFDEACVYLLRQRQPSRFNEKYRDKMLRSRLEYHVVNHTSELELAESLEMHESFYVPNQGEKDRANEKLKQYWEIKRELDGAVKGRNHRVIEKWLDRAKKSPYQPDLQDDIQRAESVYGKMIRMRGYLHPIARMDNHSILEIRNYKKPPKIIHDVMASTYCLLGERQEDLQSWEQIQYLMGQQGKDSLQKRILNRQADDVDPEAAREADENIQNYSLEKCRETSTNIGSFYKWCKQFGHDVKQRDREEEDCSLAGRETYRDMLSRDHSQESHHSDDYTVLRMSREASNKDQKDHPFAIQEEKEVEEESPRSRRGSGSGSGSGNENQNRTHEPVIAPEKPVSPNKPGAVSYAGFKPYGW